MRGYDRWATQGYAHKCVCGRTWYDVDGSPCHVECYRCGRLVPIDDAVEGFEGPYCEDCAPRECVGCRKEHSIDLLDARGLCEDCHETIPEVLTVPLEEVPLRLRDYQGLSLEAAKARLEGRPVPEEAKRLRDSIMEEDG